jgi:hypothetical protein
MLSEPFNRLPDVAASSLARSRRSSRRAAGERSRSRIGSSGCTAPPYAASPVVAIQISGVILSKCVVGTRGSSGDSGRDSGGAVVY